MGMTIAEKALAKASSRQTVKAGEYVEAEIDRMITTENFARMYIETIQAGFEDGFPRIWDNNRIHVYVEHDVPALNAIRANRQKLLREVIQKYNITNFHDVICGILHQYAVEDCIMPGELALGNDSHSISWGALNCVATAMGERELCYALVFGETWFKVPETIKVVIKGKIPEWNYAKDIVLSLAGKYTSEFALYKAIEFTGPAVSQMTMASRLCLSTHTVELGGKYGLFQYDDVTRDFILRHRKNFNLDTVNPYIPDADAVYCKEVIVDLDTLEPQVAVPHSFENVVPVAKTAGTRIDQAHLGGCTNGRVEDMAAAARYLKGKKVAKGTKLFVQPPSWSIYKECMHNGIFDTMLEAGAQILNPGCHLCLGSQGVIPSGDNCISSYTRNFKGRNGNTEAFIYLAGPETVAASAVAGKIVDPREVR